MNLRLAELRTEPMPTRADTGFIPRAYPSLSTSTAAETQRRAFPADVNFDGRQIQLCYSALAPG